MARGLAIYVFTMDIFHDGDLVHLLYTMYAAIIADDATVSCALCCPDAGISVDARSRSFAWV